MAPQYHDDEIDLRQLVNALLGQKILILALALFGATLGLGGSLLSTKYASEGLFLTPGVSTANYKHFQSVFSNGIRLQQYLQRTGSIDSAEGKLLFNLANSSVAFKDTLKPEFAFTDKDQKVFGVKLKEDDEAGAMIGIHIQFTHKKPTAGTPVSLLAEYVRDTVIRTRFESLLLGQCADFNTREQMLRNEQIASDFAVRQEEKRAHTLRAIIDRNPGAGGIDNRQVIALEKGNERFLSPAAQLTAAEILISDMRLAEERRERQRTASALKRNYYCTAHQTLQQSPTGKHFLAELANVQAAVFHGQDTSIDLIEQTLNEVDVERENWVNTYLVSMRFVASPEGAEIKQRKPGLALGIVLGALLSGMAGIFLALLKAWWKSADSALSN